MYEPYFGLKCRPFDLAPDPKFLLMTDQHARAAANIRFALRNHDSFVVITGEIGTGKTTVLNAALAELGPKFVAARLIHTTLSDIELLQSLLSAFGIANYGTKKVRLLDELRAYFLAQHQAGVHVVIIVDEAQHLGRATLEELRLLSCIDAHDRRIVTIVLTGQPSLDDVLDDPSLAQLRQRTRLRLRLRPIGEPETARYIQHRLKVAGNNNRELFTREAITEVHRLTMGIPRLINTLCDTALTACVVNSQKQVDVGTLTAVVSELGWRWADGRDGRAEEPRPARSLQGAAQTHMFLQVMTGVRPTQTLTVTELPFTIGRGPGNSLTLPEQEISKRHAIIDLVDGKYVVEDLNSRNGIVVNDRSCDIAVLASGDVISIGKISILVNLVAEGRTGQGDGGAVSRDGTAVSFARLEETQTIT